MQRPIQSTVTPSPRRRLRAAYALLTIPVAAAMALALSPAQASSTSSTVTVSTAGVRLVPGAGITNAGSRVTLLKVKLVPGYTYHVEMPVSVAHTTADKVDYAAVSLVCKDTAGHQDMVGESTNTFHGTTFNFDPRLYITIKAKPGSSARGMCVGYAQATREEGPIGAAPSTRFLTVTSAKIVVTRDTAYANARETVRFKGNNYNPNLSNPFAGHSARASKGAHFHAGPVAFTISPTSDHTLSLTGNAYLTTCTSGGGSRDGSTNGAQMCIPSVVKSIASGTEVRRRMIVQQYAADGVTPCRTLVVPNTTVTFNVTKHRHHLPVALKGTVTLPAKAGCGSHAQAWTEIFVEAGPPVVVHFPSTVTSVLPL